MTVEDDDEDGPVGYGRPPKANQFKQGQSGNPKGRPKKASRPPGSNRTRDRVLRKKLLITIDGKPSRMTVAEAAWYQLASLAGRGNLSAARFLARSNDEAEATASPPVGPPAAEPTGPMIPIAEFVNMLDIIEWLYDSGDIYIRRNRTLVLERSAYDKLVGDTLDQAMLASDLPLELGVQADDPEAHKRAAGESLLHTYELMSQSGNNTP